MCQMEIHEGQHTSTMLQAEAHNAYTILGDLEMLVEVLTRRGDQAGLDAVGHAQGRLKEAYATLLGAFGEHVGAEVMDPEGHAPHGHGSERTLTSMAHRDAELARRFETR